MRWVHVIILLVLVGCVERRTLGLVCVTDRDCTSGTTCDRVASLCLVGDALDHGASDGGRPTDRSPPQPDAAPAELDAAPVEPDAARPAFELPEHCVTIDDRAGEPQIVVFGPNSDHDRHGRFVQHAQTALQSIGSAAPIVAVCDVQGNAACQRHPDPAETLSAWDTPPIVLGPVEVSELPCVRDAVLASGALWVAPRPVLGHPEIWSVAPGPSGLASVAGRLLAATDGPMMVAQPELGDAFAAFTGAWCGGEDGCDPPVELRGFMRLDEFYQPGMACIDAAENPARGLSVLVGVALAMEVAERYACAVECAALAVDEDARRPRLLILGEYPQSRHYQRVIGDRDLCRLGVMTGVCGLNVLTAISPGPVDIGADFDSPREAAQETRFYDALFLAALTLRAAETRADAPTAEGRGRLLQDVVLAAEGEGTVRFDEDGWARAVALLDAGASLPPLAGAAGVSIPDRTLRRPRVTVAELRRFDVRDVPDADPPGRQLIPRRYDVIVDDAIDQALFEAAFSGDDCVVE